MADPSPSTRFRGIALAVAAAGVVLVPALVLSGSPFGFSSVGGGAQRAVPGDDTLDPALLGASGVLPRDDSLSDNLLASVTQPGVRAQSDPPAGPLRIPPVVLDSYQRAESILAQRVPACGLRWPLLAGLGRVISEHASGAGLDRTGTTRTPILGPRLDGSPGLAHVSDTDGGRLDLDDEWDRAAGPMQIIPGVWQRVGADSDGSSTANPHNVYDASLAAGRFLCEQDADLRSPEGRMEAVFRYKRAEQFVRAVLVWDVAYGLRAEPDPMAVPGTDDLPKLPAPESVTLPQRPPPPGPPPRGPARAPVSALPDPDPNPVRRDSSLGRSTPPPSSRSIPPPEESSPEESPSSQTTTRVEPTRTSEPSGTASRDQVPG